MKTRPSFIEKVIVRLPDATAAQTGSEAQRSGIFSYRSDRRRGMRGSPASSAQRPQESRRSRNTPVPGVGQIRVAGTRLGIEVAEQADSGRLRSAEPRAFTQSIQRGEVVPGHRQDEVPLPELTRMHLTRPMVGDAVPVLAQGPRCPPIDRVASSSSETPAESTSISAASPAASTASSSNWCAIVERQMFPVHTMRTRIMRPPLERRKARTAAAE